VLASAGAATKFASSPGRKRVTFAASIESGRLGAPGGGPVASQFVECDIDCCAACCRDCFPLVGCVDYPCCELTNCKIKF
jgi:hypothetical protein